MQDKQVPLGVFGVGNEAAALAAFRQLLADLNREQPAAAGGTVADAVAAFLAHRRPRVKPLTWASYERYCRIVVAAWGAMDVQALPAAAVEEFALSRPTWSRNNRRNFLCAVELVLRHAGRAVELDKPARESAGAESVIPEAVHTAAVASASGDLPQLLQYLWHTGCRPSEATSLVCEAVDWDAGTVRVRDHKTRGKGKQRVIYLSPAALEVLRGQREKHPAGLLFRSRRGTAYTMTGLAQQMCRISERIGERVTAYGYRHTYATRALSLGLPDTHVAALLGHGSTRMIHAHYSHLSENARLLKDAAAKVG